MTAIDDAREALVLLAHLQNKGVFDTSLAPTARAQAHGLVGRLGPSVTELAAAVSDEAREARTGLLNAAERAVWALQKTIEAGEWAERALAELEDERDFALSIGRPGPWVLAWGKLGAGATYYTGLVARQTTNLGEAEKFDVFQRNVRQAVDRRVRCVTLAEAQEAQARDLNRGEEAGSPGRIR